MNPSGRQELGTSSHAAVQRVFSTFSLLTMPMTYPALDVAVGFTR
jgi:hypothetical protein